LFFDCIILKLLGIAFDPVPAQNIVRIEQPDLIIQVTIEVTLHAEYFLVLHLLEIIAHLQHLFEAVVTGTKFLQNLIHLLLNLRLGQSNHDLLRLLNHDSFVFLADFFVCIVEVGLDVEVFEMFKQLLLLIEVHLHCKMNRQMFPQTKVGFDAGLDAVDGSPLSRLSFGIHKSKELVLSHDLDQLAVQKLVLLVELFVLDVLVGLFNLKLCLLRQD
jgi:hypothetical protein